MEQTNRTILFEEINPNKANLLTMVGDIKGQESLTDDVIEQIHKELEIQSFQQLIHKFQPAIYMYLNTDSCQACFSCQRYQMDGYERFKITLDNKNSLLSVILELMDSKKQKQYLLKNFNHILSCLVSVKQKEKFLSQRKRIIELFYKNRVEEAKQLYETVIEEQKEGLFLLTIFLQEAYEIMEKEQKTNLKDRFIADEDMSQWITPISISENLQKKERYLSKKKQQEYIRFIEDITKEQQLFYHKELMVCCMLLPITKSKEQIWKLQPLYEKYLEYYSSIIKMFWVQGKPLLEQLLGIKMFFEQYGQIEGGMHPGMVIANFSPQDILSMDSRKRLQVYLETVNRKNYKNNTLWYGIIPSIAMADYEKEKNLRERFHGSKEKIQYEANTCQEVSVLLQILAEYKIQTFVSPQITEKATYQWLKEHGIENWMNTLQEYEGLQRLEYVIPCYPNCVVIPKEQAQLRLGHNTIYDELKEQVRIQGEKRIWLDGLGVEASYIVAGLFAACQCPKYLKEKYKKNVAEDVPGVAYRMTEGEHSVTTPTTMAREVLKFPLEVIEEIQRKGAGVILVPYQGKVIVATDRTLAYQKGVSDEICHIQTLNYIQRVIRYVTQDYKESLIKQFFQNRAGNTKMQWMENQKYINSILKEGESMEYQIDEKNNTCTFTVMFEKNRKGETVRIAK